ncbi:PR-1-like protein [Metschnikowia bicuspidata var. bicuspidata NRRL YB-4993]|uniref:PR-1-like protein n=1 Tax=Metschnikowia bicuspidata var. bicuspidata NRRL YB-4993 TaxID=869754 RepID=A0A1A0HBF0_9ASCO|nr:PR-1-like protein [Metschnikowia bicuspidata var. bicuspidata NRRL YB-4993]OBA21213.1 PR-1-like protein [Metschnikowia bicuspidata var. bicuspidata NRRL YB-4993]
MAAAKTVSITRYHYVTVDMSGNIIGSSIVLSQQSQSTAPVTVSAFDDVAAVGATTATTVETYSPSLVNLGFDLEETTIVTSPTVSTIATSQTNSDAAIETNQQATKTSQATSASVSTGDSESSIYSEISSSGVDAEFAKAILDAHNEKREAHSASGLSWSANLFTYAQNYADSYTCGGSLVHSGDSYGENLAYGYSTGVAALEAWYSEGTGYDYSTSTVLDHFTQVIWQSTTELGCAYKSCSGGLYVICSYNPAGNYVGEGLENLSAD